jgi:hypothetical protein
LKTYLIQLLEITRGNVLIAAKMAGKYRADFYMLRKHNLDLAAFKTRSTNVSSCGSEAAISPRSSQGSLLN